MAMRILNRMLPVFNTDRFLSIEGAHIDSSLFQGDATLEYAERLAELGARVRVPTTLNVSGVDMHGWKQWKVPEEWAHKSHRQMKAYEAMGCLPTWTCAPYQTMHKPTFGQQIAWGESNAIAFANSVIGARTERYPDLLDICAAITGRAPAAGLHLTENRAGQLLFDLEEIPREVQADEAFYPVIGHFIGKKAQGRIPVLNGMKVQPEEDQYKALGAAMASSGAVALFHIPGYTPEAPDLEAAFQGKPPQQTYACSMDTLRTSWQDLTQASTGSLDLIILGSPHFSLREFAALAPLLKGRKKHPSLRFLVTTSRIMRELARKAGYLDDLEAFGGEITVDTCILTSPMLGAETKTIMTNSAKYAYYSPGLLDTRVAFGRLSDCVTSAVQGTISVEAPWIQ